MKYPSNTIKAITEFLFIENNLDDIHSVDLSIVLGSDYTKGTIQELSRLLSEGRILDNAKIVLSGATGSLNAGSRPEAEEMYDYAVNEYKLNKQMFLIENKATNSFENLVFSKRIIDSAGGFNQFSNILIIGKSFMLRRVSMYAKYLEYPVDRIKYHGIVDKEGLNISKEDWWKNEQAANRIMAEIERIGKYYKDGNLSLF